MSCNNLKAYYYVRTNEEYSFENALEIICNEESIGIESITGEKKLKIFPGVTTASKKIIDGYSARYFVKERISENEGIIEISYPEDNIAQENAVITSLLSTLVGDVFGIDVIDTVRLIDFELSSDISSLFPGPKFGAESMRKRIGFSAPYIGVIAKPNLGMTPKELGNLVFELSKAGVDFIKDDELMLSPKYCKLSERTKYIRDAIERAKSITGKETLYAINISADAPHILENAYTAYMNGANCLMLNAFVCGFDSLREIAMDPSLPIPVHVHRCMHDIFTRNHEYGIAPAAIAKFLRLCGGDFFHIGTFVNKLGNQVNDMMGAFNQLTSHSRYNRTIPIISRSSILSIPNSKNTIGEYKDIMYLFCGAYYRSQNRERALNAIMESINLIYNGTQSKSEDYYDCYSEIQKMIEE